MRPVVVVAVVVHSRRASSLQRRTLGFARIAHRVTRQPTWALVPLLRCADDPAVPDALQRCGISPEEWSRWSPVVHAPTLARALDTATPPWVLLALATHKVASSADAEHLHRLVVPRPSLPLLVLAAHALAYYSLVALLPPLSAHFIRLPPDPHAAFYFNTLLQAISLFDRSRVAADIAIDVLNVMQNRALSLWPNTQRVLIRDNFRSPQLLDHLRRRDPTQDNEAWLRAYASLGRIRTSAHYLHAIRNQCLQSGIAPPYTTEDNQGTAHTANTYYLRAMRDDRRSAFQYFHHLLKRDLATSPPLLPGVKSNIDVYDWTTALHAAARDRALSASSLLDLFEATKQRTSAYRPTRATYTVVIQGLLWRNTLEDAQKLWDEFVVEVVSARGKGDGENMMRIDRKALCVGIDVLVQSRRTNEALHLLDEAVERDINEATPSDARTYLKVHPIHALLTALLRIRRPDAIFYIWTHLTSLYFVPPTNLMLRILLKAAIQASKMDGESFKGAMSWYVANNRLFKGQSGPIVPTTTHKSTETDQQIADQSRETLSNHLHALFQTATPPTVVGIWAGRRSTEIARSIFRGMIFGNWPALRGTAISGGVTRARAKGGESIFQEFARVFVARPTRFLPSHPPSLGSALPTISGPTMEGELGPPLPTVMPSESTFATYISLLGLSSRAEEIPEVLVWMHALHVRPKTETLAIALVFWMEVGLRGPVFEDGWGLVGRGSDGDCKASGCGPPKTEYGALRAWIREWVGEKKAPTEEDIYAGIKRVSEMRDGQFGKRGGHVVMRPACSSA